MFGLSFITNIYIEAFLLVFLRLSGWIMVSPIYGRKNLPPMLRIGFGLLMTIIVMLIIPLPTKSIDNVFEFFVLAVKELSLGMILGYVTLLFFYLAVSAGQIIDMQIGFGMSNFFDPQFGMQIPLTGNLLNILLMLLFFSVNGHHILIGIIHDSFSIMPPGQVTFGLDFIRQITSYFIWFFILVIKLALPIIAVTLIIEFALGIIIKTMPQMNMFVVGIPLKIVVGIISLILFLSTIIIIVETGFDQMYIWHQKIIQGMINK